MWANEVACNTTDTSTCDDTLSTAGIHPWHTTGVAQLRQTFVTKLMGEADCDVFVCAARAHCEQTDSLATRCDHLARNLNRLSPAHFILLAFLSLQKKERMRWLLLTLPDGREQTARLASNR